MKETEFTMQSTRLQLSGGDQQSTTTTVITEEGMMLQEAVHYTHHGPVELIPDCLEHIFKYLSTADKGRVAKVRLLMAWTVYEATRTGHGLWPSGKPLKTH